MLSLITSITQIPPTLRLYLK